MGHIEPAEVSIWITSESVHGSEAAHDDSHDRHVGVEATMGRLGSTKGGAGTMRILLMLNAIFLLAPTTAAQRQREFNLMPMPSTVQLGTGALPIDQSFSTAVTGSQDATLERGVRRFVAELSQQTGMLLKHKPAESSNPTLLIHADHDREPVQKLSEDESYELAITDSGAKLTAPTPLGILHGLQTFLQLVETTPAGFA